MGKHFLLTTERQAHSGSFYRNGCVEAVGVVILLSAMIDSLSALLRDRLLSVMRQFGIQL